MKLSNRGALFAYGTLMWPEVFKKVTRIEATGCVADLLGYQRYCVKNAIYPGMIKDSYDNRVQGILYESVDTTTWELLDRFEGYEYECLSVHLECNGEIRPAWAYCFKDEYRNRLTDHVWKPAEWKNKLDDGLFSR